MAATIERTTQNKAREPEPIKFDYTKRTKLLCDLRAQLSGANGIMAGDFTLARVWHQHPTIVETASLTAAWPLIDKASDICNDFQLSYALRQFPYDPELYTVIDEIFLKLIRTRNGTGPYHHPRQRHGVAADAIKQTLNLISVVLQRDCDLLLRAMNEERKE